MEIKNLERWAECGMWRSRHARAVVRRDGEGPPSKPSAQCPVIPAIEASVRKVQQLLWPSSPRAQRSGEWQRRAARPTQTDRTNGRTATEQRDDAIPRPASSVQRRPRSCPSVHPSNARIVAPWAARPFPARRKVAQATLGFWLHLLCCSKPSGHSTRGPATEPGTHQQEGAILAILLSPSPVAPLALSTCSYGRAEGGRAGEQNKNNSCQPPFSPPPESLGS